ncbi:MAG: hypothetical protein J6R42_03215 [Clostridia bacterium]|nr:hypothetical protein [Clostridia bacterium]
MDEHDFKDILSVSLDKIKSFADTETVIGHPIELPSGLTLIPISRVSMGLATGGLGFQGKKTDAPKKEKSPSYSAGGGTGVSITPMAFLAVSHDGTYDLIPIKVPEEDDTVGKITSIIEKSPDILEKIKKVILPKKKDNTTT